MITLKRFEEFLVMVKKSSIYIIIGVLGLWALYIGIYIIQKSIEKEENATEAINLPVVGGINVQKGCVDIEGLIVCD